MTVPSSLQDIVGKLRKIEERTSTTQFLLESDTIIKEITQPLGWGYLIKDKKDGQVEIVTYKVVDNPIINKTGIINIIQFLRSIVNKNTFLSKTDEEESLGIIIRKMQSFLDDLAMNFDIYGLDSPASMDKVFQIVYPMTELAIYRARDGATLDYLQTVQKFVERIATRLEDDKGKGLKL